MGKPRAGPPDVWSIPQTTTTKENKFALGLAKRCFDAFTATDIAGVLLAFKSRKLTAIAAGKRQLHKKWFQFSC
jgi:hypothetical protein